MKLEADIEWVYLALSTSVLVPEVKVVGGSGSLEAQKAGEPSRKRTRGNDADIKPDIALLDTSSLPKFALDEDFQTIRAIVKFIVSSPPSD